jgi:RNA-directed DNA polymerase
MNAKTCAPSDIVSSWSRINWDKHYSNVRKLQMRIVKAQQEGRYNKVKALQGLLTHSVSAKLIAVKSVTESKGKNTPGIDNIIWDTEEKKMEAVLQLKRRGYKPIPLRRIFIPKKNGKKRPLGIPSMKERAMQALYLLALDPVMETISDGNSYGFRKERSTRDAIEMVFISLAGRNSAQWVLEGDIKSCFDKINHNWLNENVSTDKRILSQWLKSGIIFKGQLFETTAGTPQGGVISPCLARAALNGLQGLLECKFKRKTKNGIIDNPKVNVIIYADDFVITGKTKELLYEEVLPMVEEFMNDRGLELSQEKTVITHINDGFNFLGQNVRKYNNKLIIKPSKDNVKTFLQKIREVIKINLMLSQEELINILNPKIRGWANYHRHIVSKRTFSYIDNQIYEMIWKWMAKRHPNKGRKWIARKYFHSIGTRKWVFSAIEGEKVIALIKAADTKIVRHKKIKSDANPYDPQWDIYFEEREGYKMFGSTKGYNGLKRMWSNQNGMCPICNVKVTKDTGWKLHKENSNEKFIVHPKCHIHVHNNGIQLTEPADYNHKRL